MSPIQKLYDSLDLYLKLRRGLGFELGRQETRLRHFIAFLEKNQAVRIETKWALQFAMRPGTPFFVYKICVFVCDTRIC